MAWFRKNKSFLDEQFDIVKAVFADAEKKWAEADSFLRREAISGYTNKDPNTGKVISTVSETAQKKHSEMTKAVRNKLAQDLRDVASALDND